MGQTENENQNYFDAEITENYSDGRVEKVRIPRGHKAFFSLRADTVYVAAGVWHDKDQQYVDGFKERLEPVGSVLADIKDQIAQELGYSQEDVEVRVDKDLIQKKLHDFLKEREIPLRERLLALECLEAVGAQTPPLSDFVANEQAKCSHDDIDTLVFALHSGMPKTRTVAIILIRTLGSLLPEDKQNRVVSLLERCSISPDPTESAEAKKSLTELPQGNAESEKTESGCFIATACYGDINHPDVCILRNFRDDVLLQHFSGRIVTKLYYVISPPIARRLSKKHKLSRLVKSQLLEPLVNRLKRS